MKKQLTQIKKGTLEFCVLAALTRSELYGYDIGCYLRERGMDTPEGTIYPLLSRLRKEELVEGFWQHGEKHKPRKYYRITDKGRAALQEFKEYWLSFSAKVNRILWEK